MYEHGQGVNQDDSMAMRWYAKAAAQGHERAQVAIRELVSKRRGSSASSSGEEKEKWATEIPIGLQIRELAKSVALWTLAVKLKLATERLDARLKLDLTTLNNGSR